MSEVEWNTASGRMDLWDGSPSEDSERVQKSTATPWEADGGPAGPSKDMPRNISGMQTRGPLPVSPPFIHAPDSPQLPAHPQAVVCSHF